MVSGIIIGALDSLETRLMPKAWSSIVWNAWNSKVKRKKDQDYRNASTSSILTPYFWTTAPQLQNLCPKRARSRKSSLSTSKNRIKNTLKKTKKTKKTRTNQIFLTRTHNMTKTLMPYIYNKILSNLNKILSNVNLLFQWYSLKEVKNQTSHKSHKLLLNLYKKQSLLLLM